MAICMTSFEGLLALRFLKYIYFNISLIVELKDL